MIDGKFVDVIGLSDASILEPQFKKYKDASQTIRTNEFMSAPVFNAENDLSLNVQIISRRKRNSKFAAGFTNFDEIFFHLFVTALQTKLHQILAGIAQYRTQQEVVSTIRAASVICTQRSYSDYIMNCREILPEFFGFEGVGILFRDSHTDNLFSIEDAEEEGDKEIIKVSKERARKNEHLTREEAIKDAARQYRKRSMHVYPNSLGVTGQAFHTGEIIYANKMRNLTDFLPSIDNLTPNVKDVQSLMVVPIYGHKARMVVTEHGFLQEALPPKDQALKPIAIMQFVNKTDFKQIDEYDIAKIDAMRDLLGMSIDNASEHHSIINARVGVQENMGGLTKIIED